MNFHLETVVNSVSLFYFYLFLTVKIKLILSYADGWLWTVLNSMPIVDDIWNHNKIHLLLFDTYFLNLVIHSKTKQNFKVEKFVTMSSRDQTLRERSKLFKKKKKLSNYHKKQMLAMLKTSNCHPNQLEAISSRCRVDEDFIKSKY